MVRLVAQAAVDMTDLAELGLLGNWSKLHTPNTIGNHSHFNVSRGDVKMAISGDHLTIIGGLPALGTVEGIAVSVGGNAAYQLTGISFALNNIQSHFHNGFESTLFAKSDTIYGSNLADLLVGYAGNDVINGRAGADVIKGGTNADRLFGGNSNDRIYGQQGNDRLDGGLGNDLLSGGAGNDSFVFDYQLGPTNVDTIADFTKGQDHILLDNGTFFGVGGKGPLAAANFVVGTPGDVNDYIIYDQANGDLYFDPDGSGSAHSAVKFAHVTPGLALSASDFLVI